jgi:predicted metal-binding protein
MKKAKRKPGTAFEQEARASVHNFTNDAGETLYYERHEAIISISSLDYAEKNKIACEACHTFGKNFACPPFSPYLPDYLDSQVYAKIVCIRMPQEYFNNIIQEKTYKECFRTAQGILVDELVRYREKGYIIAGSGSCPACNVCGAEKGAEECNKPNTMIYSLESLGVNLTSLTRQCFGFELEWSGSEQTSDFVCSLGAIFFNEDETFN